MNQSGLDWLNIAGNNSTVDSNQVNSNLAGNGTNDGFVNSTLAPPPVSFGFSSPDLAQTSSTMSNSSYFTNHSSSNSNGHNQTQDSPNLQQGQSQEATQQDKFNSVFNRLRISSNEQYSLSEDNLTAHTSGPARLQPPESQLNQMNISASTDTLMSNSAEPSKDEDSVPLSLTIGELTQQEAKTYLRWYNDILTRKGTKTITLDDVFKFLSNFKISQTIKHEVKTIFKRYIRSLNIGQFFALLRIVAHALQGQFPSRALIRITANVPRPISILSRKRLKDSTDSESDQDQEQEPVDMNKPKPKLDLDNFAQFLLTGERPISELRKKRKPNDKRVKFSDQLTIEVESDDHHFKKIEAKLSDEEDAGTSMSSVLDYNLPMDQLLQKLKEGGTVSLPPRPVQENLDQPHQEQQQYSTPSILITKSASDSNDADDEEELKDMQDSINHFKNVNIDSVSIHGTPNNIPSGFFHPNSPLGGSPMGLSPQTTGPEPVATPLAPNLTGSVSKSMRSTLYVPHGNTTTYGNNQTLLNFNGSQLHTQQQTPQPAGSSQVPVPPPSRIRSQSSPQVFSPRVSSPLSAGREQSPLSAESDTNGDSFLKAALTGSRNYSVDQLNQSQAQMQQMANSPLPPTPPITQTQVQFPNPATSATHPPPPPPPSRMRATSTPVAPAQAHQLPVPLPPPPRARKNSNSPVPPPVPPLPPHHVDPITYNHTQPTNVQLAQGYTPETQSNNSSGNDLLDGLRALQNEVDRLKNSSGF